MRLAKTDIIAGVEAPVVRDLMRRLRHPGNVDYLRSRLPPVDRHAGGPGNRYLFFGRMRLADRQTDGIGGQFAVVAASDAATSS